MNLEEQWIDRIKEFYGNNPIVCDGDIQFKYSDADYHLIPLDDEYQVFLHCPIPDSFDACEIAALMIADQYQLNLIRDDARFYILLTRPMPQYDATYFRDLICHMDSCLSEICFILDNEPQEEKPSHDWALQGF